MKCIEKRLEPQGQSRRGLLSWSVEGKSSKVASHEKDICTPYMHTCPSTSLSTLFLSLSLRKSVNFDARVR